MKTRISLLIAVIFAFVLRPSTSPGQEQATNVVRLAIGTFGITPASRDGALADLLTAGLSAAPGFEVVERREVDRLIQEQGVKFSGLMKANDAVRIGRLLPVDQFLLGTSISLNGTNRLVIRLVDARSGTM